MGSRVPGWCASVASMSSPRSFEPCISVASTPSGRVPDWCAAVASTSSAPTLEPCISVASRPSWRVADRRTSVASLASQPESFTWSKVASISPLFNRHRSSMSELDKSAAARLLLGSLPCISKCFWTSFSNSPCESVSISPRCRRTSPNELDSWSIQAPAAAVSSSREMNPIWRAKTPRSRFSSERERGMATTL